MSLQQPKASWFANLGAANGTSAVHSSVAGIRERTVRSVVMRTLLTIVCFGLAGCASPPKQMARIDYSDGVDKQEAAIIADDYLRQHLSASLGHTGPYDSGKAWSFRITGDVAPVELPEIPPVLVDKSTGVVTWEARPPLKK